jgi:hypothetical protein
MSDLTFLPWLTAGASAAVNGTSLAMGANRPKVQVALAVTKTVDGTAPPPLSAGISMDLLGPGDVLGLAPGQVIRTEPADGATGVETTIFPAVEFGEPTLPWLFTPAPEDATWPGDAAPAKGSHQLLPWICLVTVPDKDGITLDPGAGTLTIAPPADARQELPDLREAWAWAHVQYAGDLDADATGVTRPVNGDLHAGAAAAADTLANGLTSGAVVSRLLSPRQLTAGTRYHACVVPVFSAGRVAGLGGSPDLTATASPAWDVSASGDAELILPVYYSFTFTTGVGGDFQSLAQLLVHPPQVSADPGASLGPRTLTVTLPFSQPPGGKLPITVVPLPMPGMLEPVIANAPPTPPPPPSVSQALQAEITPHFANQQPELQRPELLPTAYGAVQAGVRPAELVANFGGIPAWFATLNTDPRLRVAAALGTQVVAAHREQLVAAAWSQVEQTQQANALLSRAKLARAVTARHRARHLATAGTLTFLQLTSPHASRVRLTAGGVTGSVRSVVQDLVSGTPGTDPRLATVTSAAYRRIARPRGPHARNTAPPVPPYVPFQLSGAGVAGTQTDGAPQFDPAQTVLYRTFAERLSATAAQQVAADQASGQQDLLRGFAHQVSYPAGMITPLARLAQEAILPGAATIPINTALILQPNPEQVVAYLVGLNTEISRLLVWRGVPADPKATPFCYFWDQRGQAGGGAPDITAIAGWQHDASLAGQLTGQSGGQSGGSGQVILAVRAELLRRYPNTAVYAAKATAATSTTGHIPDLSNIVQPSFTATLPPDLHLYGFPASAVTVSDAITGDGWFFVFQQQLTETRFGSDAMAANKITPPAGSYWTAASLAQIAPPPGRADVIADAVRMTPVLAAIHARALQLKSGS